MSIHGPFPHGRLQRVWEHQAFACTHPIPAVHLDEHI